MIVTGRPGQVTIERHFDVEDGPVIKPSYRTGEFKVRRILIRWELDNGGAWMLKALEAVGGILRKDGTAREDFNDQANRRWTYLDQAPAWLQTIVLAAWPTGHPEYAAIVGRTFTVGGG